MFQVYESLLYREHYISVFHLHWQQNKNKRAKTVRLCCAQLRLTLCGPMNCSPPGSSVLGDSPGKNSGVGYHAFLQGIFPTQGSSQVSCITDRFLTSWSTREAQNSRVMDYLKLSFNWGTGSVGDVKSIPLRRH